MVVVVTLLDVGGSNDGANTGEVMLAVTLVVTSNTSGCIGRRLTHYQVQYKVATLTSPNWRGGDCMVFVSLLVKKMRMQ